MKMKKVTALLLTVAMAATSLQDAEVKRKKQKARKKMERQS